LPTGITATGHFEYISIDWTNPADADLNFVEIWEADTDNSASATRVGISGGNTFQRTNLGLNVTKFYFLKAVDYSGNASAFTTGVSATTTYLDDEAFANGIYSLFTEQGLYAIEDVTSLPPSGDFVGQKVFNRTDGKLYSWTGTAWEATVADVAAGSITATEIADGAISTPKLAANSVVSDKIAGNTITGNKIVANTITGGLLATSGIITNSAQINDAVITNAKIENAAITTLKIGNNQVTFPQFAQGSALIQINRTDTAVRTLASITVNQSGAPAQITGHFTFSHTSLDSFIEGDLVLRANGVALATLFNLRVSRDTTLTALLSAQYTFSGSVTYALEYNNTANGSASQAQIRFPQLTFLELKR
jgi:uncharacterized protein YxjI